MLASLYSLRLCHCDCGVLTYPGRISKVPAVSVAPWMLECPRSALTPPPGRPTLPSRSCSIAAVRIIWTPTECCVQPSAYMTVPHFCAFPVDVTTSATFRNVSFGVPQIFSTISGVYRSTCFFRSWKTQFGSCRVGSVFANPVFASSW